MTIRVLIVDDDPLLRTEMVRRRPGAPEVVILTTFDADEHVLRALRAGAAGFVLKDTPRPRSSNRYDGWPADNPYSRRPSPNA